MRFAAYRQNGIDGLAASVGAGRFHGLLASDLQYPGDLAGLLTRGGDALGEAGRILLAGHEVDLTSIEVLPPLPAPGKESSNLG